MHSVEKPASAVGSFLISVAAFTLALAGCGSNYRPVVTSINPVGPATQPQKYAVAISSTGTSSAGRVTIVDFSGDTILTSTAIGANPQYLAIDSNASSAFVLNGDGTVNSFGLSTSLRVSDINQTTLPAGAAPASILSQGTNLYIAETGRNAVAQLTGAVPPVIQQEIPAGANTVYTVGTAAAPRVYAIVQGAAGSTGTVVPIDTSNNTRSGGIAVGATPVYGVMTTDAKRAFILNKGSNTVSVLNAQTNALDTFTVNGVVGGTIPVGVAPVWADLVPQHNELVVVNAGNGTTAGSVTVVNIPLCSATSLTSNPNCDPANPVDATGFGAVVANIPVGVNPVMVAVLADGTRAYVANAGNAAAGINGSISVVNLTSNTVTATIPAAVSTNANDAVVHGHPAFIAVSNSTPTGKVYVTAFDSNDLSILRTDIEAVITHLPLQGAGIQVRVNIP